MIESALAPLLSVARAVPMAAVAVGAVVAVAMISPRLRAFARGRACGRIAASERVAPRPRPSRPIGSRRRTRSRTGARAASPDAPASRCR